jgi:ABC-type nickel/cobalt efflux system permease component RcnA
MRGASFSVLLLVSSLCLFVSVVQNASAHPVPKENHDRTIEVVLTPTGVQVKYQLEVDESRAELDLARLELPPAEFARIRNRASFDRVFQDHFGPILAGNLFARLDGKPLIFTPRESQRDRSITDHLRYDFTFTAKWAPELDRPHTFDFREANYEQEDFDQLRLTMTVLPGVTVQTVTAPDKALLERPPLELKPGDSERLRKVSATFVLAGAAAPESEDKSAAQPQTDLAADDEEGRPSKLLHLLLDTRHGLVVLLLLAAGFGAVHALTPGHGKTLVAAYLVGQHGTVWHALLLGLMTTLTHTGAVFVLAIVFLVSPGAAKVMYYVQGLVGGLFIAVLGLWLLFQRLSGRADHFHLGGHSHHHHHHDHAHAHTHDPIVTAGSSVRWWHLILLGMRGGLMPCWDAIILLCLAISAQRLWLGVPLLLAFSAGLAGVLVSLGISVVWARDWAAARWGGGPRVRQLARVLPLVSAALITSLGLWLCYASLHPETPPTAHASEQGASAP